MRLQLAEESTIRGVIPVAYYSIDGTREEKEIHDGRNFAILIGNS
jgi:hypothetical protein